MNLFKAVVLTIFSSFLLVSLSIERLLKNELAQFHLVTQSLEDYKSTLFLFGALFESELKLDPDGKNTITISKGEGAIYPDSKAQLLEPTERVVIATAQRIFSGMPSLRESEEYVLYYRSYIGNKVLASKPFPNSALTSKLLTKETCAIQNTCTKYLPSKNLDNGFVISPIYQDDASKGYILTMTSPVYLDGKIIGDVNVDVYLANFGVFNEKVFLTRHLRSGNLIVIADLRYPFHEFAFHEDYLIDDDSLLVYRIPFTKVVMESLWIIALLLVSFVFVIWKLDELKLKRKALLLAQLAVNRDEMTGLYNRGILKDSSLKYKIQKYGLSVIAIDGDKLKLINDQYGHLVGDEAIKHIANNMTKVFHDTDYLLRIGGDEFLALLPGNSIETAQRLAANLAFSVGLKSFSHQVPHITISFGVAEMELAESLESVIERADAELYLSKNSKQSRR
jgi:diguanylate cyclase (GGDEF)-like protein